MAGIGFELKKLFKKESFSEKAKAYLYSALVSAGPWIAAVLTVNVLILIMDYIIKRPVEKELFMGTIVYCFIFSQILTAPWQFLINRYISDCLYLLHYDRIRPSFLGLNKIVIVLGLIVCIVFYYPKNLPVYYKFLSTYLFLIITMIWIVMVYLSAVKNYSLIAKAYILGGFISVILTIYFYHKPIPFPELQSASNLLSAYLIGMTITYIMLAYTFLSTFYFGSRVEFDFIKYLDNLSSLFFIGLFYTLGLWIDDIIMWFSIISVTVYDTYLYAPIYDNAVFFAYLTIIPTMVLFLVSVETEFYDTYKIYYNLVNGSGTLNEIEEARKEMQETIIRKTSQSFIIQALISTTIVFLSRSIFNYFNISILIRDIFRICTFGALFNIYVLIVILIFLYFEARGRALVVAIVFFVSNVVLTWFFVNKGLEYFGYGFLGGCLLTFILGLLMLNRFFHNFNYRTFNFHPIIAKKNNLFFEKLSLYLNKFSA